MRREWLSPGVHVNSVGRNPAGRGEVDAQTVADALLVVESRESTLRAASSRRAGARSASRRGSSMPSSASSSPVCRPGRSSRDEITLYKSVGVAVQDVAAAALVLAAAQGRSIGLAIELEE